jgi:hypothetical protein
MIDEYRHILLIMVQMHKHHEQEFHNPNQNIKQNLFKVFVLLLLNLIPNLHVQMILNVSHVSAIVLVRTNLHISISNVVILVKNIVQEDLVKNSK